MLDSGSKQLINSRSNDLCQQIPAPHAGAGEGAALVKTCEAMCGFMKELAIAVDGGKDSLSMAAKNKLPSGDTEVIKGPGTLVISAYAPVPDIRVKVTPELKSRESKLVHIDLSGRRGKARSGASALAQVFSQVGDEVPDIDDARPLQQAFPLVQSMIRDGICTAGHDVSDGGLITCLLEMAFCSNVGLDVSISNPDQQECISYLLSEECGVLIEVPNQRLMEAEALLKKAGLTFQVLGQSVAADRVSVKVNGELVLEVSGSAVAAVSNDVRERDCLTGDWCLCTKTLSLQEKMTVLRDVWEETSFRLELLQTNSDCAREERSGLKGRKAPAWSLTFDPEATALRPLGLYPFLTWSPVEFADLFLTRTVLHERISGI